MGGFRRLPVILVFAVMACSWAAGASATGTLEGRWLLVEQHYGKGQADQAPKEQPVRLEFLREGGVLSGRISAGSEEAVALAWPALVVEGVAREIRIEGYETGPGFDSVRATYTVPPRPGDDLVLKIVEEYRVAAEGRELIGTATVSFVRAGEPRGSYVLHRRFERQP